MEAYGVTMISSKDNAIISACDYYTDEFIIFA